jgi:hypothetical protein
VEALAHRARRERAERVLEEARALLAEGACRLAGAEIARGPMAMTLPILSILAKISAGRAILTLSSFMNRSTPILT